MNKQQEIYFNSKLYDQKQRRIGVIGEEIEGIEGKLRIWELTCSNLDNFRRKEVKEVYREHSPYGCFGNMIQIGDKKYHPEVHFIEIKKGDSVKYTFDFYCKTNFYHKTTKTVKYSVEFLDNGKECIALKGENRKLVNELT